MRAFYQSWRRIAVWLRQRFARDLDEEIRFHLDEAIAERVRDGASHAAAKAEVLRQFGNVARHKEDSRAVWLTPAIESVLQDFRYGGRMIVRNPGFAFVAMLTLALGLAVNSSLFSVVHGVLLKPLPVADPDRLVTVFEQHSDAPWQRLTGGAFHDLQQRARTLRLAEYRNYPANFAGTGMPEQLESAYVSPDFFAVVGVQPQIGRAFSADEFSENRETPVILSYGLWRRRFAGNPSVIGQPVTLHGRPARVVGVMPREFAIPESVELWVPLTPSRAVPQNHRAHLFTALGRLSPSVALAQSQAELQSFSAALSSAENSQNPVRIHIQRLHERMVADVKPALMVLVSAGALLLLIACANVANLLLARGALRGEELAMRLALGASRSRIARQLIVESSAMAIPSGMVGLLLSWWTVKLLPLMTAAGFPRVREVAVDLPTTLFSAALTLATVLVSGLAPALRLSARDPRAALGAGGRTIQGGASVRLWLVSAQVALALVMLIGAGLLIRSSWRLQQVERGFDERNVLTFALSLTPAKHSDWQQDARFSESIRQKIAAIPGVESAAVVNALPTRGAPVTDFEVRPDDPKPPNGWVIAATPDYFRTLRIPILRGRGLSDSQVAGTPVTVVVSETMARNCWPGENPIGRTLTMKDWGEPLPATVIGVAGDVRQDGVEKPPTPAVYFNIAQFPNGVLTNYVVARTTVDPMSLSSFAREAVWSLDRDQPVAGMQTLADVMAHAMARRRLNVLLLACFGSLALVLATSGLYSALSYSVTQRRREIAIRIALGAQSRSVIRAVMAGSSAVIGIGLLVGLVAALGLTQFMRTLLFGIGVTDAVTFAVVTGTVAAFALLASYVPARRATRVDPMVVLRSD